jgi:hypothetical protein
MTRRDLIALLGSTAAAWPLAARAQQMTTKTNLPTIGWVVLALQHPTAIHWRCFTMV